MRELTGHEMFQVLPLACAIGHSRVFVSSVLEGKHRGRVFVDDMSPPTVALVSCACGFHFWLGRADDAALNLALQHLVLSELAAHAEHLLLFPCTDTWGVALEGLFEVYKPMRIARASFDLHPQRFRQRHADWRRLIPEGLVVRRYDRLLAESAPGIVDLWGTHESFLQDGLGYAVLKSERAVSRCHSVLVGDGRAEVSIETQPDCRRQGLATLACCAFVEGCLDVSVQPEWSCWPYNAASIALAEKLGFERAPDVPVIYVHQQLP